MPRGAIQDTSGIKQIKSTWQCSKIYLVLFFFSEIFINCYRLLTNHGFWNAVTGHTDFLTSTIKAIFISYNELSFLLTHSAWHGWQSISLHYFLPTVQISSHSRSRKIIYFLATLDTFISCPSNYSLLFTNKTTFIVSFVLYDQQLAF